MLRRGEYIVIVQDEEGFFLAEVRRTGLPTDRVVARSSAQTLLDAVTELNVALTFERAREHYEDN